MGTRKGTQAVIDSVEGKGSKPSGFRRLGRTGFVEWGREV
jgi:hypothetical protein